MSGVPRSIDVEGLEAWLGEFERSFDVASWRRDEFDLWPLFATTVVSLGILARLGLGRRFATGSAAWRAAVLADEYVLSPLRGAVARGVPDEAIPSQSLDRRVLLIAGRRNAVDAGRVLVCPPLDVPSLVLTDAGWHCLTVYKDLEPNAVDLDRALMGRALGLSTLAAWALRNHGQFAAGLDLEGLPGFSGWVGEVAPRIDLGTRFLSLWLARQVAVALAYRAAGQHMLAARGKPAAFVMLASGFADTCGLAAAARRAGIPAAEVQHGAERPSAITSPSRRHHFSRFNSAPDRLVSWRFGPSGDPRVFNTGPIGLHLPRLLSAASPAPGEACRALSAEIGEQGGRLAAHARSAEAEGEALVSGQIDDDFAWLETLARSMPPRTLFWLRHHPSRKSRAVPSIAPQLVEADLASSVPLALLLARVQVHVTRFSAVTLEAAAAGVPTIALDRYAGSIYGEVPEPLLVVCEDHTKAAAAVRAAIAKGKRSSVADLPSLSGLADFLTNRP